jgi:alkylation response protein AidB-like acyl-CoA dehydrogenase
VDFTLTTDQRELAKAPADFARWELNQNLAKRDDAGECPRDAWRACARFGARGLPVPLPSSAAAVPTS